MDETISKNSKIGYKTESRRIINIMDFSSSRQAGGYNVSFSVYKIY